MSDYVTHDEFNDALAAVKQDIRDTEDKLRAEFTSTVRFEVGRVDAHLGDQDEVLRDQNERINWILGLIVTLLITIVGALIYVALSFH